MLNYLQILHELPFKLSEKREKKTGKRVYFKLINIGGVSHLHRKDVEKPTRSLCQQKYYYYYYRRETVLNEKFGQI